MPSIYTDPEYRARMARTVEAQRMIEALRQRGDVARAQAEVKGQIPNPALKIVSNLIKNRGKDAATIATEPSGVADVAGGFTPMGGETATSIPSWAGGSTTAPMTPIEGALANSAEANAAYNAPAMAASEGAATPFFSLSNGGMMGDAPVPVGNYLPGIAGLYGAYDLLKKKKHGAKGAKQGAASGAGIGLTLGGPAGAGIGAVIGGTAGYFGNFGDVDRYQDEAERAEELRAQGIPWNYNMEMPTRGRSKDELIAEAIAAGRDPTFARTRDESALSPVDITGYAALPEKLGAGYANASQAVKELIAAKALEKGAVNEHHGTIDIDWDPKLEKFAKRKIRRGK